MLSNQFSAQVFHAVPEGSFELAAELLGDVFDGDECVAHNSMSIIVFDRICRIFF